MQYPGSVTTPANYHQTINRTFEWLWENTISYDKTFGKHAINFVGGVSAQKNTWTGMGGGGIPPNNITRDLSSVNNLTLDREYSRNEHRKWTEHLYPRFNICKINLPVCRQIHDNRHSKKRWVFKV